MNKPFYKYNSYWLALAGVGVAYLYVKLLAKDKNLSIGKSLLIGGALGGGVGIALDLLNNGKEEEVKKIVTRESLNELAKSISPDAENELSNYLLLLDKANLNEFDNQKGYNVLNGFLLAKKDNKWDSNSDIQGMKKTLISYGVTEDDFKIFQAILVNSLANAITNIFSKNKTTE